MVAVVTGNGLGLFNASNNILGSTGKTGQALLGQAGVGVYVNAATGNLLLQSQDENLSGRGADLRLLRTYNSAGQLTDMLGAGKGWTLNAEQTVIFDQTTGTAGTSGVVRRTTADGHVAAFTWSSGTTYVSHEGGGAADTLTYATVTTASGTQKVWTFTDGSTRQVEVYSDSTGTSMLGKLMSQTDVTGNVTSYTYDPTTHRLASILDGNSNTGSQQLIQFGYDAATGRLTSVSTVQLTVDNNGRAASGLGSAVSQVTYGYDSQGRLQTITTDLTPLTTSDSAVYTLTYAYDGTSNRISSLTQSDGTVVSFAYYLAGDPNATKIRTVTTGTGASAYTQTFTYSANSTGVADVNGTWTYQYDNSQRLTEIDAPAPVSGQPGLKTLIQYDQGASSGPGNVTQVTQSGAGQNNRTTRYLYDGDNWVRQSDSLGNTVTRTYNTRNQVTTETHYTGMDPSGSGTPSGQALTTRYVYDDATGTRLRFIISAEGRVTENRYASGSYGNLTASVAYEAGRYDLSTLSVTAVPTEAQLITWASHQDQTQTELTQYSYDLRGNLASQTQFGTVNSGGVGVADGTSTATQYIYDGYGQLLKTIAVHGTSQPVLTAYVYDGLGRMTTATSANVTVHTTYDDAHGRIQTSNDGSGLVETRTYDARGLLLSLVQTVVPNANDPSTSASIPSNTRKSEYLYDAAGRVQVVQQIVGVDGQGKEIVGSQQFRFYDADGRVSYTVDATGAVCGYGYNASGQVLTEAHYATRAAIAGWVSATLVTAADGTRSTAYTINKTALTVGTAGTDVLTNSAQDRTTTYVYDDAGRLQTQTDAAGTVTTTRYDGDSRVVSRQTAARTTTYYYDADGLRVGTLDPLGYLTEYKYDGAARLVDTVRYSNRSPVAGDRSAPVWSGVTAQNVNVGRPFVYHLPAAYDADGDTLYYKAVSTLPSWLTFDATTLTLSGIPPQGMAPTDVTLQVADRTDASARTANVTVHLTAVNAPPDWADLPDVSVEVNTQNYSLALPPATDNETDAAHLTYTVLSDTATWPPGLSIAPATVNGVPTLVVSGTPTIAGSYLITVRVTDQGAPAMSTDRSFVVRVTNEGLSWNPDLSQLPSFVPTQRLTYTVDAAVDPDRQALTYRIVSGPSWLSIDPNTHVLSGTPPASAATTPQGVVLEAQDPSGAVVRTSFTLKVGNRAPTWANQEYSVLAGSPISFAPAPASDLDGDTLKYHLVSISPSGLDRPEDPLIVDPLTGALSTRSTNPAAVGNYTVTIQVSDGHTSITNTITVHLLNTPPVYNGGIIIPNNGSGGFDANHGYVANPVTILIPHSAFSDFNGPVTLSVDGAVTGPIPGGITMPPGIYFDPNYTLPFTPVHGALDDMDVGHWDPGTRPIAELTWYDPSAQVGFVKQFTIRATDGQGASIAIVITLPPLQGFSSGGGSGGGGGGGSGGGGGGHPLVNQPSSPSGVNLAATVPPFTDALAGVRPGNTDGLHTYQYYDDEGRLTGVVDERGFLTETVYDSVNNQSKTIKYQTAVTVGASDTLDTLRSRAGAGESSLVTYDDFGRISTTDSVTGLSTQYEYDAAGRLARSRLSGSYPGGTVEQRSIRTRYDAFGEVIGTVSGVGEATLSSMPTPTQIDQATAAYGVQYQYDSLGRRIKATDANGHNTLYFYDLENRLTHTVDAAGDVVETIYNAFGQASSATRYSTALSAAQLTGLTGGSNSTITALITPNASFDETTGYDYDQRGLVTTVRRPLTGFTTTDTYDAYGDLSTQTRTIVRGNNGAAGITTTAQFDYDLDGQLIAQTDDVGGLNRNTQIVYDAFGRVVSRIDGMGVATTTSYIGGGRAITVTDALNHTVRDDFDSFGRVIAHTDANGKVTSYSYDDPDTTSVVTSPEGRQVTTIKDSFGETRFVIDGRANTTQYDYDKDGHLKDVIDATGATTTNTYDASGRLTQTTDARGVVTQYTYDVLNRVKTRRVDPNGLNLTTTNFYDAFGRIFRIDEGSRTTSYKYDQEDRLTAVIVDPAGLKLSTSYSYDGLGDTIRIDIGDNNTARQQVTQYVYDNLGRRIKEIDAPRAVVGAGSSRTRDLTTVSRYDAAGRVTRKIDASGQSTWFVYDAAGKLKYTIDALGDVTQNDYDSNGRIIGTRRYSTALSAATVAGFGDTIASFTPPPTSTADARSYFIYESDGLQRFTIQALTSEGHGSWAVTEKIYDASGNVTELRRYPRALTNEMINAVDTTSSPGLSIDEVSAALVSLGYVDDHSLAGVTRTRYAYDADNRLRFTVDPLGAVTENVYDSVGNIIGAISYAKVPTLTAYTEAAIGSAVDRKNPANHVTLFAYDSAGRLVYTIRVLAVDSTGAATQQLISKQFYDNLGEVVESQDYATVFGSLADYSMATLDAAVDPAKVPAVANNPQNRTTYFAYDSAGRQVYRVQVLSVDSSGKPAQQVISKMTYDALNRVVQTTQYANLTWTLADHSAATLDAAVDPAKAADVASNPRNRTTANVYDAAGRQVYRIQVLAVDGTGHATQQLVTGYSYDAVGRLLQATAYATVMTAADFQIATLDRMVDTYVSDQDQTTSYVYDAVGDQIYSIQSLGADGSGARIQRVTSHSYDALGRLVGTVAYASTFSLADCQKATVDNAVASSSVANNPSNRMSAYVYDLAGEQVYSVRTLSVDGTGKPTSQIISRNSYDTLGQLVKTTQYAAPFALADYRKATVDAAVSAAAVANDPLNRTTAFVYDITGQQIYSAKVLAVDGTGKPTAQLVVQHVYDALGRLVQTTAYASSNILPADYTQGRFDTAVKAAAIANDPLNRTSANVYDALGRLAYHVQVLARDSGGQPTRQLVTKLTYNAFGQVIRGTAFAKPMTLADYQLGTLDAAVASNATAQDRTTRYIYDDLGRQRFVIGADNASLSETLYDALGQVSERRQFGTLFTLDPARNYQESDLVGIRGSAVVGDGTTRGETYTYDSAGRLLTTTDAAHYTQTNSYDAVGNLLSFTDKNGNTWTYTYDALGQQRTQLSPTINSIRLSNGSAPPNGKLQTTLGYDVFGDVTTRTAAANTIDARTTTYAYDNLGRQTSVTLPGWYDPANGKVVNVASGSSPPAHSFQRTVETGYDAFGNLVSTKTRTGESTYQFTYAAYDALGRKSYDIDALNNVTGYTYDAFDDALTATRYSSTLPGTPGPTNTRYWLAADAASAIGTDTRARTITSTYDLLGRLQTRTQLASSNYYGGSTAAAVNAPSISSGGATPVPTTTYEYDAFGDLVHDSVKLTGSTNRDTWHYFDVMGRERLTVDAGNYQTSRTYDAVGNLKTVVESATAGQPGSLSGPPPAVARDINNDRITIYGYDARNLRILVQRGNLHYSDGTGQDIYNGYDSATTVSSATYDGEGRVTTQTDALGNTTSTQYNALGQVTAVIEAARVIARPQVAVPGNSNTLVAANDPFVSRVRVTPVTAYTLNAFGQIVQQTRSAVTSSGDVVGTAISASQSYDYAGNLISTTDADQNVTNRQVDYAGRVIRQTQNINVTLGNWKTVSQTIQRRFAYDAAGRQTDVLDLFTGADGTLQQSGERKAYNAFGEMTADYRVWGGATTAPASLSTALVASYAFDNDGQLITKIAGDGVTTYFYDLAGQLTRQELRALPLNTDGTVHVNADGTVTPNNSIPARITELGYDVLGHLITERLPAYSARPVGAGGDSLITPILHQQFDRWGNVISRTQGSYVLNSGGGELTGESRTTVYRYNADNRLIAVDLPVVMAERADGTSYQAKVTHESHYDLAGRLVLERDVADNLGTAANEATQLRVRRHEYNEAGQRTADVDAMLVRTEYIYDVNGNRVGTRNVGNGASTDAIVNTVFVDGFDANGNLTSHSILRQGDGSGSYVSGSGQTPFLYVLQVFTYDQANRRVASGDVMHVPDGVFRGPAPIYWTYSQYDERNLLLAQRTPNVTLQNGTGADTGLVTSYAYDSFGDKTLQLDGNNNGQTWTYSTSSFITGQLRATSVGLAYNASRPGFDTPNRTTTYAYTGFGQIASETYTGANLTGTNSRVNAYYENGLLQQVSDNTTIGTPGPVGNDDYVNTTATTAYDYTVNGEQARAVFNTRTLRDDATYDDNGNLVFVGSQPVGAPATIRTTLMSYDAQGRLVTVTSPASQNSGAHSSLGDASQSGVVYHYDELGNRREIDASFHRADGINPPTSESSQKWYDYNAEGQMTIVDGTLDGGKIKASVEGSTEVTYDALGRRYTTNKFVGPKSSSEQEFDPNQTVADTWKEFATQKYDYNDLGYLNNTWQAITRREGRETITPAGGHNVRIRDLPEGTGTWYLLESRTTDVRGSVTEDMLYTAVASSTNQNNQEIAPYQYNDIRTHYLADGRLDFQDGQQFDAGGHPTTATHLSNQYDSAGIMKSYLYQEFGANPVDNFYNYGYTMEFGGYQVKTITVTPSSGHGQNPQSGTTTNYYDSRGNLILETIANPGQTVWRSLSYDNNGQIIAKQEVGEDSHGNPFGLGYQDFYYVQGHQVAALGTGSLDTVQFNNDFTPVTTQSGTMPGSYVIKSGDTLASIAQAVYGDAQLWYLIADANNVGFSPGDTLPQSEIGRSYRIPTALLDHNTANTFAPYNASSIIGNSTPSPYLPPPPGPSCADQTTQILAVAVVVAVTAVVSAYTAGALAPTLGPLLAGAVGGVAGDVAGQTAGIIERVRQDYSGTEILDAGLRGGVSAGIGGAGLSSFNQFGVGVLTSQGIGLLEGRAPTADGLLNSLLSAGANLGADALMPSGSPQDFRWSAVVAGLAASTAGALNPFQSQPFSWTNVAAEALNGLAGAAAGQLGSYLARPQVTRLVTAPSADGAAALTLSTGSLADGYAQNRGAWNRALTEDAEDNFETPLDVVPADFTTNLLGQQYTTTSSDSNFEALGRKFYGDPRLGTAIAAANGIDELKLRENMQLYIPAQEDLDLQKVASLHLKEMVREQSVAAQKLIQSGEVIYVNGTAPGSTADQFGDMFNPPSMKLLEDLGMRLDEPDVQRVIMNPDLGKQARVQKTLLYQGVPFQTIGYHTIGTQPNLDADMHEGDDIVEITNRESPSEIANRTGQSNYLTFAQWQKTYPHLAGDEQLSSFLNYRRAADGQTADAWYRENNAAAIADETVILAAKLPFIAASLPGSAISLLASKGVDAGVSYLTGSDELGHAAGFAAGLLSAGPTALRDPRFQIGFMASADVGYAVTRLTGNADIGALAGLATGYAVGKLTAGLGQPTQTEALPVESQGGGTIRLTPEESAAFGARRVIADFGGIQLRAAQPDQLAVIPNESTAAADSVVVGRAPQPPLLSTGSYLGVDLGIRSLDPTTVSFTQSSVSFGKLSADYNLSTLINDMSANGWRGSPVDAVVMPDGTIASIDNTRILASRYGGSDVQAFVHAFDENFVDPVRQDSLATGGNVPQTWGEAALLRINKVIQDQTYPFLSPPWTNRFPYGSVFDPVVTVKKQ